MKIEEKKIYDHHHGDDIQNGQRKKLVSSSVKIVGKSLLFLLGGGKLVSLKSN